MKRTQILAAASRLFLADGFAGTSMDAVVAAAGVSKQTLYRYFPSKNDLLAEVLTSLVSLPDVLGRLPAAPATLAEFRESLIRLGHGLTGAMMRPESIGALRLVLGEAIRLPALRDLVRQALPAQLLGLIEHMLADADARGLIASPRPDLGARMLFGSFFSFVALDAMLRETPTQPPSRDDITLLVDSFLLTVEVAR